VTPGQRPSRLTDALRTEGLEILDDHGLIAGEGMSLLDRRHRVNSIGRVEAAAVEGAVSNAAN